MKKNQITFNSVVFGFMVNGEPVGVEFHNKGKGKINGRMYGNTYEVRIKYSGNQYSIQTSLFANKTNAKLFIEKIIEENQ